MLDAVKGALQVVSGVGEVTIAKAREAAVGLLSQGEAGGLGPGVVEGVQQLADDLWATGKDNQEMLLQLVRLEVDRAVNRMGFVREDELASVRRHVDRLEAQLAQAQEELNQAREDAATTSIVVTAESSSEGDIAASVVDSARRIAAVTGALGAVPGLAGGPWARVARDLATSAAGIVAAAATQQRDGASGSSVVSPSASARPTASAESVAGDTSTADTLTSKTEAAKKPGAKKAGAKKSQASKAAGSKTAKKQSGAKPNAAPGKGE